MTHPALLTRLLGDEEHSYVFSSINSVTVPNSVVAAIRNRSAARASEGSVETRAGRLVSSVNRDKLSTCSLITKRNRISRWVISKVLWRLAGYCETCCKFLKQLADKNHYELDRPADGPRDIFDTKILEHRKLVTIALSEREAKFFLDRKKQCSYHDHKFFSDFFARSRFHLHALGKVVNCCSHFWGGARASTAGCEGTRFRKAETGTLAKARYSIQNKRSFREDRPDGVICVSGNREESELIMFTGKWHSGGKGEASIV